MARINTRHVAVGTVIIIITSFAFPLGGAQAQVTVDGLSVQGDSAELSGEPSAVTLDVSGSYAVDGAGEISQSRLIVQVTANGQTEELDQQIFFDAEATSGEYRSTVDLLSHAALSGADLLGDTPGETVTQDITVRIILQVVADGNIVSESTAKDTASLTVTNGGYDLSVNGTGTVSITA